MKYKYDASIIIPTRNRAKLLLPRLKTIFDNTPELRNEKAELIIAHDEDDKETHELLAHEFALVWAPASQPFELPCIKWNNAAKIAQGEWLVTMSDDSEPEFLWLESALDSLNYGFLALPDGVTGARNRFFTPLYMATREWLKKYHGGVLVIPKYKSWYADIETAQRAHRSHSYILAGRSVVAQLHPTFGNAPDDEMYRLGRTRHEEDKRIFEQREKLGFPNDFEGVL